MSGAGKPERARLAIFPPQHLAAKILASRSGIEGKSRDVTVLVGDLVESNQGNGGADADARRQFTGAALRFMAEAVHRYSGMVDGSSVVDGVIAFFGAPVALSDHALGAVKAALGIKQTFNGFSAQLREELGVDVQPRLGLNSGSVIVQRIGDDLRMEYAPVGDTTEMALRLLELAEPGSILITETTYRRVAGWVSSEPLVPLRVAGRADAVCAYRLTGRRRSPSPGAVVPWTGAVAAAVTGCPRCQQSNRSSARFCKSCGSELQTLCQSCRTPVGPNSTFCDTCGVRL